MSFPLITRIRAVSFAAIAFFAVGHLQADSMMFTTIGETFVRLGISQGFFGNKNGILSDALSGYVDLESLPTGPMGMTPASPSFGTLDFWNEPSLPFFLSLRDASSDLAQVDTIIEMSGASGPIEVVSLSLQSKEPIMVTYGDGAEPPEYFSLIVYLDPSTLSTGYLDGYGRFRGIGPHLTLHATCEFAGGSGDAVAYGTWPCGGLLNEIFAGPAQEVPEHGTLSLLVLGLFGLIALRSCGSPRKHFIQFVQ